MHSEQPRFTLAQQKNYGLMNIYDLPNYIQILTHGTLMHTCILLMTSPKGDRQGEESWVIQHPFPASDHPKQLVSSLAGSALLG